MMVAIQSALRLNELLEGTKQRRDTAAKFACLVPLLSYAVSKIAVRLPYTLGAAAMTEHLFRMAGNIILAIIYWA
jgi:hypothetical protein